MDKITQNEFGMFLKLFIRDGYVLDFSTDTFNTFTLNSIGVALCEKYQMSKGRSLTAYINEAPYENRKKLIVDLFNYYKCYFVEEYSFDKNTADLQSLTKVNGKYSSKYFLYYNECKKIIDRINKIDNELSSSSNYDIDSLKDKFSNEYLSKNIDLMMKAQADNPTEAIGKAKELIESCCKTILENLNVQWDKKWDVGQLAGETMKHLKLMPEDIPDTAIASKEMKSLLGNLRAIATNLGALRNPYGSGHGKSSSYKGLQERHAKLAVGSAITFVNFLWDTYEDRTNTQL